MKVQLQSLPLLVPKAIDPFLCALAVVYFWHELQSSSRAIPAPRWNWSHKAAPQDETLPAFPVAQGLARWQCEDIA
jgi:hypothetical protein